MQTEAAVIPKLHNEATLNPEIDAQMEANNRILIARIANEVDSSTCTPIVSNQFFLKLLFGEKQIASAWASKINYPFGDTDNLTRVAQYLNVLTQETGNDAKTEYLSFLKTYLIDLESKKDDTIERHLNRILPSLDTKSFTELVFDDLDCQSICRTDTKNPLYNLACLPFNLYITTSPHRFLEKMLKKTENRKLCSSYAFRWDESVPIPREYVVPERIVPPQGDTPLIYYLYGVDTHPQSLVITEYDHLDFLLSFKQDFKISQRIPEEVSRAITTNRLLLLDYDVDSWELRALLKGIEEYQRRKRDLSVAIQIDPGQQARTSGGASNRAVSYRDYLQRFFEPLKFEVIFMSTECFMAQLVASWQARAGRQP